MSRDYKKTTRKKKTCNCRNWFFSGILLGAVASALICYEITKPEDQNSKESNASTHDEKQIPKPRFDFYTLLPETEIDITEDVDQQPVATKKPVVSPLPEKPKPETKPVVKVETPSSKPKHFQLQLGSFTRRADADKFKAELAFKGIASKISKVTINNQVYYRVIIGPIKTESAMKRMRAKLKKQSIDSMVIKKS